jgi:hypothetical protein
MSGNVQKINTNLTIASICPIVISQTDAILSFATAETIARNVPVGSGFRVCAPSIYSLNQVYTTADAHTCCGVNVQPTVNATVNMSMGGY